MTNKLLNKCIVSLVLVLATSSLLATDAIDDPLEGVNRSIYYFNQMAYHLYIKPVAHTYDVVFPVPVKESVHNGIRNMGTVRMVANDMLQGKLCDAWGNGVRFVINSTLGIFGLFDVATPMGWPERKIDLGRTFYAWGWRDSSYFVIPIIGPSTIRDAWGVAGDYFMSPPAYFKPKWRNAYYGVALVDAHHEAQNTEDLIAIAGVNDYDFVRSSFIQHRMFELTGGAAQGDHHGNDMLGEPPP